MLCHYHLILGGVELSLLLESECKTDWSCLYQFQFFDWLAKLHIRKEAKDV